MSFSIRNPAELQLNKPYRFTRDINGYSYTMTMVGERNEYIRTQETQWLGLSPDHPTSRVWEFNCEYPNGSKGSMWLWERSYVADGVIAETDHAGVWTPLE
jgi:hypothetical protein